MACCHRLEIHLEKIRVISLTDGFLFFEGKDDVLVTAEGHGDHVVPPAKTYVPATDVELDTGESWPSAGTGPVLLTIRPTEQCRVNVRAVIMVWEADPQSIESAVKATSDAALKWAGTLAAATVPNPGGLIDSAIDAVRTVVHEILELFGLSNDLMMDFYLDLNQSMDSTVPLGAWDWGGGWDSGYPQARDPNQVALRKTEKRHGGEWEVTFLVKRSCGAAPAGGVPGE